MSQQEGTQQEYPDQKKELITENQLKEVIINKSPEIEEMEIEKPKTDIFYIWVWVFELAKGIFIFLAIIVLIHFFIATIFVVEGPSMEPNFHNKQYIIVEKISYLVSEPVRGDVVVIKFPGDPENQKYIKRIIGLPGDALEIKNGKVYINEQLLQEFYIPQNVETTPNQKIILKKDEYFIMGDNRPNSNDSRAWGVCPKKNIIGRAWMIIIPVNDLSLMPHVDY